VADVIPVIVCIDIEPDERIPVRPSPWVGYGALQRRLAELRPHLPGLGSSAHFAWFLRMDPQIDAIHGTPAWGAVTYRVQLDEALAEGDALGLHVHSFRQRDELSGWLTEFGDQAWVDHCLDVGLAAFEAAWGRKCASFRFGDGWMNDATVARLQASGIRHDLTLEPGKYEPRGIRPWEPMTGAGPDLRSLPREPYHPSVADFRRPDPTRPDSLWIIPVTTGRPRPGLARLRSLYRAILRPRWITSESLALNPALSPPLFRDLLDQALESPATRLLVLAVRSDAGLTPWRLTHVTRNLEAVARVARRATLAFCTPAEALGALGLGALRWSPLAPARALGA
jgi:hypothetical protein